MAEWDRIHDLKVLLVYRKAKASGDKLCKELSEDNSFKGYIDLGSIKMRIKNYRAIDPDKLENYAPKTKKIFCEFKGKSIKQIEQAIKELENNQHE